MKTKLISQIIIFSILITGSINSFGIEPSAKRNPCAKKEYQTNRTHFRSNAVGESSSMHVSKSKALTFAKGNFADEIIKYIDKYSIDNVPNFQYKIEVSNNFIRKSVHMCLNNVSIICEKTSFNGSKYKTAVALEISKEEFFGDMLAQLKSERKRSRSAHDLSSLEDILKQLQKESKY